MNSSSAGSNKKNEVMTIDLCLSDTDGDGDDDDEQLKPSSASSSLKRSSGPGKRNGGGGQRTNKGKRPKPDPAAFADDADNDVEIIEISDDDDGDDDGGMLKAVAAASASSASAYASAAGSGASKSRSKRKPVTLSVHEAAMIMTARVMAKEEATAGSGQRGKGGDNDDDEVEVVDVPADSEWRQAAAAAATSAGAENRANGPATSAGTGQLKDDRAYEETNADNNKEDDDDEEFELVTTKGTNALVDFPHSRENCVQFSFANGDKKAHCDNCYCYVCDIPAKDCTQWQSHCQASHGERRWREERERFKRLGIEAASAAAQPTATAAALAALAPAAIRMTAPAAVRNSMSTGSSSTGRFGSAGGFGGGNVNPNAAFAGRPDLRHYSITALLQKLTSVHPVEVTPPASSGVVTNLRHYQKQSLAFMLDIERSTGPSPLSEKLDDVPHRGGFLCDEVGMGKSAVVLALVASNPLPSSEAPSREQVGDKIILIRKRLREQSRINRMEDYREREKARATLTQITSRMKIKATVILTSVSLLGQWEDECRKHCPSLVVRVAHRSRVRSDPTMFDYLNSTEIHKIDVILSTSTFHWEDTAPLFFKAFEFRRVVVDESHLFGKGNSASHHRAKQFPSARRWCVTATPCTGCVRELGHQLFFLGNLRDMNPVYRELNNSKARFYNALDALKPIVIRHTKSQRINGSAALALPPSSTTTTLVDMSAGEKRRMGENIKPHLVVRYRRSGGEKAFTITKALGLSAGYGCQSKLALLCSDLQTLRSKEPSLRAVVFTQSRDTHVEVINAVRQSGFEVLEFSGSTSAKKRDESIRNFQAKSTRPAVFVITMRAGNVGITLTAASRVYLMEPCLDPAVEVQAAGRIHRLGQTKPVHVIRYAFKDSPEYNITKLHKKVVAGKVSITDGFVPARAIKILAAGI